MKKIVNLIYSSLLITTMNAQSELSTHFLRDASIAYFTNPAFVQDSTWTIGLPGIYNSLLIDNITFNDLIAEDREGAQLLNVEGTIPQLEATNLLYENYAIESFNVAWRNNKTVFSLGHRIRYNAFIDYPKTLPQLIWQGNAQFIGESVSFGPDLQLMGYHEIGLGIAHEIAPNLTVGATVKQLSGISDISISRKNLALFTDELAYELTMNADFQINSTGNIRFNSFRDLDVGYSFGRWTTDGLFSRNTGWAFDLGVHYEVGRWNFAASVLDIGSINWKERVVNYALDGTYDFAGLDVAQSFLDDEASFGSALDSLEQQYDFIQTNAEYSTNLPSRYYLSATFQLNEKWTLGALYYGEEFRGQSFPAIAVSARTQLRADLSAGATFAYRQDTADNIGLNVTYQIGQLQITALTDNIVTAFRPLDTHRSNVRIAGALQF